MDTMTNHGVGAVGSLLGYRPLTFLPPIDELTLDEIEETEEALNILAGKLRVWVVRETRKEYYSYEHRVYALTEDEAQNRWWNEDNWNNPLIERDEDGEYYDSYSEDEGIESTTDWVDDPRRPQS